MSVMNGFEKELQDRILGVVPHAIIYSNDPISDYKSNIDFLKKNEKFVGRLAMLSSFGFICNELVTGNPTVSF